MHTYWISRKFLIWKCLVSVEKEGFSYNDQEAMLVQDIANCTEFKFYKF